MVSYTHEFEEKDVQGDWKVIMKIAVIGLYYASNLGDAVICDCTESWVREAYPEAEIDVLDIEGATEFRKQVLLDEKTARFRKKEAQVEYWLTEKKLLDMMYFLNKKEIDARQEFYDSVMKRNYDIAVLAGGQLLMDWLSLDVCEFIRRFEQTGTAVFLNACGTGQALSKKICDTLKANLSKNVVKYISSRDNVDEIDRLYLSGNRHAIKTFDPALWTDQVYQVKKKDSRVIGLGVMNCNYIPQKQLEKLWVDVIEELDRRQMAWQMFCNGAIEDYDLGKRILEKLHLSEDKILKYPERPKELVEQISTFSGIISFRLHSHIIAASLDIPSVALVWDDKLKFFFRGIGHEERCFRVEDDAKKIVDGFVTACSEGYDRQLIEKERQEARKMLLDAIEQVVCNE